MSIIFKLESLNQKDYKKIAEMLQNGALIIYPTETIYGIGCNATDNNSVNRVVEIKKRILKKNFIHLFRDINMVEQFVDILSPLEKQLMEKYWPGSLSIVLKRKLCIETIACRVSPHFFLKKIFNYIDFPLISTSANFSGENYTGDFNDILKKFKNKVDIIIDSGNLTNVTPSTLVKVKGNKVIVLRQGSLCISK